MYRIIQQISEYSNYPKLFIAFIIGAFLGIAVFNLVIIPFHNCVKYFFIRKFGDETVTKDKLLTMNPLKNFHAVGLLSSLTLNIGFAAPTYYDTMDFKRPKIQTLVVALSGVVTYFFCFGVIFFVYVLLKLRGLYGITSQSFMADLPGAWAYVYFVAFVMVYFLALNCLYSAIFNFIPILPLDMGDVLYMFLPINWQDSLRNNELFASFGLFVAAFLVLGTESGMVPSLAKDIMINYQKLLYPLLGH